MDKIFVAMDNKVLGFNKKKKLFFQLEMNAAEPIKSMYSVCTDHKELYSRGRCDMLIDTLKEMCLRSTDPPCYLSSVKLYDEE